MKFSGIILKFQLDTPKRVIIRAGSDIADAETKGTPADTVPSRKLRTQICQKLIDAINDNDTSIEIAVQGGKLVED